MKIVIDANRLFSLIISKRLDSAPIQIFFSDEVEFVAPLRILAELEKNREEIKSKSGFSHEDFDNFVSILKLRIRFLGLEDFLETIADAKLISPDAKDMEYFALALKLDCSIWSEEKRLKEQPKVRVLSTKEMFKIISG